MASEDVKQRAVQRAKDTLSRIPFQSVENYSTTLFNNTQPNEIDASTVDFLKNTQLRDIQFENEQGDPDFIIKNTKTSESIAVSNRGSTKGELRGALLRTYLNEQKIINNDQSIYDAIDKRVKDPNYSNLATMTKNSLTGEFFDDPMSAEHFDLFLKKVIEEIAKHSEGQNETIMEELKNPQGDNKGSPTLDTIIKQIEIELENIYERSTPYNHALDEIQKTISTTNDSHIKQFGEAFSAKIHQYNQDSTIPVSVLTQALQAMNSDLMKINQNNKDGDHTDTLDLLHNCLERNKALEKMATTPATTQQKGKKEESTEEEKEESTEKNSTDYRRFITRQ